MIRIVSATILLIGSTIAACGQDAIAERPKWDLRRPSGIIQVQFSADGKKFFSAGEDGKIILWDVEKQKPLREYAPKGRISGASFQQGVVEKRHIEDFAISPDGRMIAEATAETQSIGYIRTWEVDKDYSQRVLDSKARDPRCVVFSPDGKWIVANMRDGERAQHKLVVWDAETGKVSRELRDDRLAATSLAFSPDGATLASAGGTKVLLWDFAAGKVRHEIRGHKRAVRYLTFSASSELVGTVSDDDMAHVWKASDGTLTREWSLEQSGVQAVAFSMTGRTLATAGKDKSVKLWNPTTGRRLKTLWGHADRVMCLAFSPDGKTLASGAQDGLIAFWNIEEATYTDQDDKKTKEEIEAEKRRAEFEKQKQKEKEQKEGTGGQGGRRGP